MKHIETTQGIGRVWDEEGNDCGTTRYEIDVYQDVPEGGATGLKTVAGTVEDLDSFKLMGKHLILELEDGRKLPFFISADSGAIAARGALA